MPANTAPKDSSQHSLKLAAAPFGEKKLLSTFGPKCTRKEEAKESGSTPQKDRVIQNASSKSADKGKNGVNMVAVQANISASISITDAAEEVAGNLSQKKRPSESGSVAVCEDVEEHRSILTADIPPLVSRDSGDKSKSNKNATGCSNQMKKLCKSDLMVNGNKEVGEHCTAICESLNLKGNQNFPIEDKPADSIIHNVRMETTSQATGVGGRKENSNSGVGALIQAKNSTSDIGQKLCDFAMKMARKQIKKEPKTVVTDHNMKGKEKSHRETLDVREGSMTDTEKYAMTSASELLDQKEKNAAKQQLKEEGAPKLVLHMTEVAADKKSNLDSWNSKAKTSKSNSLILKDTGFSKTAVVSTSCSTLDGKKQESGGSPRDGTSNQSLDGKITRNPVQPAKYGAKEPDAMPKDGACSASQSRKKRRTCADCPLTVFFKDSIVQTKFKNSPRGAADWASKGDLSVSKSCSDSDSCSQAVASLSAVNKLNKMKTDDLHHIAKHLKLTKYHKLRKQILVELIANQMRIGEPPNGCTDLTCL